MELPVHKHANFSTFKSLHDQACEQHAHGSPSILPLEASLQAQEVTQTHTKQHDRAFGNASASGVGSSAQVQLEEFQVAWEQAVAAKWLALEVRPQEGGGRGFRGHWVLAATGGLGRCLGHTCCMTQGGG